LRMRDLPCCAHWRKTGGCSSCVESPLAFGTLAFAWPGLTLLSLTLLWGAYAMSDGVLALWAAVAAKGKEMGSRWWLALAGIVSFIAGVMTGPA
jgi:uncharacterized membrane protein HdeD (DUF308 family)